MIPRGAIVVLMLALGACSGTGPRDVDRAQTRIGRVQHPPAAREPWRFHGNEGWTFTTPSATLHTTLRDRAMLARLPSFIELAQIHARSLVALLPEPERRVTAYMLGSRAEWESMTRRILGERAGVYLAIERGGYSVRDTGVFYDIGPKDSFTIAAHEGWHQLARSVLADPLPTWLDEGLACYAEGFRWDEHDPDLPEFLPWANLERFDQLRAAHARGSLMPLRTLVSSRPEDLMRTDKGAERVLTYYAQLWALIHFFRESGHSTGLARTITLAHQGRLAASLPGREARLLRSRRVGAGVLSILAPGHSLEELDERYRRFVARVVDVGGRDAVLRGDSPLLQGS